MSGYKRRLTVHARLSRGGYMRQYEILDGEDVVGRQTITREARSVPEVHVYLLPVEGGDPLEFKTFTAMLRARDERRAGGQA